MTPEIHAWVKLKVEDGVLPRLGNVLEVGSRNVNGTVRELFEGCQSYMGVDREAGEGVDVLADACELDILRETTPKDLVICLETLEHIPHYWLALAHLRAQVKRPGGLLLISAPTTGFPEHRYPLDCQRFMADAFRYVFFEGMEVLALDTVRCPVGYPSLIGIGRAI